MVRLPRPSLKLPKPRLRRAKEAEPAQVAAPPPSATFVELERRPAADRPGLSGDLAPAFQAEPAAPAPPAVAPLFEPGATASAAEPADFSSPPSAPAPAEPAPAKRRFGLRRGGAGPAEPKPKRAISLRRPPEAEAEGPAPEPAKKRLSLRARRAKEPSGVAGAPAPKRFALRFKPSGPAKAAAEPSENPSRRFALGRRKQAVPEAPGPPEATDAPAAKRGFALRRTKPAAAEPPAPEAAPAKKRGFTIGKRRPEPEAARPPPEPPAAPEPAAPEPEPVPMAPIATVTPIAETLAPPVAEPGPEPELGPEGPAPFAPAVPRLFADFDAMHLRVDRILSERSPLRLARPPDRRELHQKVDDVLRSKRGRRRRTVRKAPKVRKARTARVAKRKTAKKRA